jgi:subtilase family serine protease
VLVCGVVLAGMAAGAAASPGRVAGGDNEGQGFHVHTGAGGEQDVNACSDAVAPGIAHCLAHQRIDSDARAARPDPVSPGTARPSARAATLGNNGAYDPSYLQSAYDLAAAAASAGGTQTVAIVDAYDDPNASADLTQYRSFFGVTCPTGGNCLTKVDEHGGNNLPAADSGWSQEISLDLDMVSAICPKCHILLVEAASASFADLGQAAQTAASLGATAISNSYGGGEFLGESLYDSDYNHPGIAVTVSSGDSGYGVEYPAASQYVTAVGGTTLYQSSNGGLRAATETAWNGAGSGCSAYEPKPTWQKDTGCARRTVADVSAVADPSTGVWVYDTYGGGPWMIFGGTSVASPIVAATYALAGNPASQSTVAQYPYLNGGLNDVVSGSNGSCGGAATAYLCTAQAGYDGPTGLGTPNTPSPFVVSSAPLQPPAAPTGLRATAGNAQVALSWSSVANATSYNVYRSTTSGGEASSAPIATSVPSASYTDTTVSNNTTYYYEVTAVGAGGPSTYSTQVAATPKAATVPGAPRNLTLSARFSGVRLTWSAPTTNGGSSITYYVVYRGTSGTTLSLLPVQVSCSASSCTYTDGSVSHSTTYWYEVAAHNTVGTGSPSNEPSVKSQ